MYLRASIALMALVAVACGSSSSPRAASSTGAPDAAPGSSNDGAPQSSDASDDTPGDEASGDDASGEDSSRDDASAGEASANPTAVDAGGATYTMNVTFYGWPDNSPPGNAIAYPKNGGFPTVHDGAGGTGTFADPITLATDEAEIPVGTILYIGFIEKYLVMEDDCTECDADWSSGMHRHVDVWMNSNAAANAADVIACEDQWTQAAAQVEVNAPPGLPVTTSPLFDPTTNTCRSTP
jgi:3D (Asp-Asp-Asp) domain-containing protein